MNIKAPELLAPAGNLEKLKIAFTHGADACFIGGTVFGLRKFADNFDDLDLKRAIDFAHDRKKKVYVVLNGYAHNTDIDALKHHLDDLEAIHPDGFIISDIGVMQLAKRHTSVHLHTSTQASVTNVYGCKLWKNAGASRIILAREVSIDECVFIKSQLDIELEVFVHGAMCASYSGKCVISNYTAGRDSNRGGCIQSCRHTYEITAPTTPAHQNSPTYVQNVMNAKDLMGISLIPKLIESNIDSLKIEGRMKSNLYVANTVSMYRAAIDHYMSTKTAIPHEMIAELQKVSNRTFSTGGLEHMPDTDSIHYDGGGYTKGVDLIGTIKATNGETVIAEIKVPFTLGDTLEIVSQSGKRYPIVMSTLTSMSGETLQKASQNTLVQFTSPLPLAPYDILRKPI